jgi:hypothetical protein
MDKTIGKYAKIAAILVFFIMGLAGWFCRNEPAVCAWRGLIGAVVMYAAVRIAGAVLTSVIINAAVEDELKKNNDGDKSL